jgi:PAS domain S-box-containing protein
MPSSKEPFSENFGERRKQVRGEKLLRDAIESISEGFVIYDDEGRLVMCNRRYATMYSEGSDRFLPGVHFEKILRGGLDKGHYAGAIGHETEWLEEQLRAHRYLHSAFEHQLHDGRWVLVTKHRMANGWTAGLRVNITTLKAAQVALVESEERLKRAQRLAHLGSIVTDLLTGEVEWSDETYRIFGVTRETFVPSTENVLNLVHPGDRALVLSDSEKTAQGTSPMACEYRIIRPDGAVRHLSREGEVIRDASGVPLSLVVTVLDVTERRRTEAQLRQAQKMEAIGNLTGGMAHDFNNLLGVIIGNLELARERIEGADELSEIVKEAHEAAWRGADLTRRLLAFARLQALDPTMIRVNELVSDTVKLLDRLLGEDIEVVVDLAEEIWPVMADPAQLEASLTNLATNARDAMPRGGRLSIKTSNFRLGTDGAAMHAELSPGDYALIEVSDTGIGMPPETVAQIFEPFFSTKEPGKGTGLGLSIVFGFLRQSGGYIDVYSEPGLGMTFRLYLPRSHEADTAQAALDAAPSARGAGECVLVVEDKAAMRRIAVRLLRDLGYRVLEAERAHAALELLQCEPIDLLLTDIVMPGGLDGVELARLALERWPALKIVLTSGFPDVRTKHAKVFVDCFPLLQKPYSKDELAHVLRDALDRPPIIHS